MPYENVTIDCEISLCSHNEKGECTCDCHVDELTPDDSDCSEFNFQPISKNFDVSEMDYLLETIEKQGISFCSLDNDSKHFQSIPLPKGGVFLVQGSEELINEFKFWKHVDGGIGYTYKHQLELQLA